MKGDRYIQRKIVVEGRGPFPIDMLRYDSCVPATEEDAVTIRITIERERHNTTERVTLYRFVRHNGPLHETSLARWSSKFHWTVVSDELEE